MILKINNMSSFTREELQNNIKLKYEDVVTQRGILKLKYKEYNELKVKLVEFDKLNNENTSQNVAVTNELDKPIVTTVDKEKETIDTQTQTPIQITVTDPVTVTLVDKETVPELIPISPTEFKSNNTKFNYNDVVLEKTIPNTNDNTTQNINSNLPLPLPLKKDYTLVSNSNNIKIFPNETQISKEKIKKEDDNDCNLQSISLNRKRKNEDSNNNIESNQITNSFHQKVINAFNHTNLRNSVNLIADHYIIYNQFKQPMYYLNCRFGNICLRKHYCKFSHFELLILHHNKYIYPKPDEIHYRDNKIYVLNCNFGDKCNKPNCKFTHHKLVKTSEYESYCQKQKKNIERETLLRAKAYYREKIMLNDIDLENSFTSNYSRSRSPIRERGRERGRSPIRDRSRSPIRGRSMMRDYSPYRGYINNDSEYNQYRKRNRNKSPIRLR
jgi:hypothetical protein